MKDTIFDGGRFRVPKDSAGERFDRVLDTLLPGRSLSQVQKLVRRGRVKCDGERVMRSNFRVEGGEQIIVRGDAPGPPELVFLHEADDFAVIDKAAGDLVYPPEGSGAVAITAALVERYGPLPSVDGEPRPGIVHRLDRGTSGVLVIARTTDALHNLRKQFEERSVEKRYLAVVYGDPRDDVFEVDRPIGPSRTGDMQRVSSHGKPALSRFRVIRRWGDLCFVECLPHTGRTHQLRVHLQFVGHPIVGDEIYRPDDETIQLPELQTLALHAEGLAIDRPGDGKRAAFHAPLPEAWKNMIRRLG